MKNFESNDIPVIRHLDDVDDLRTYGRDGILLPEQETTAIRYANEILKRTQSEGKSAVLLLCSTLKRGVETGHLIAFQIKKEDPKIKIRLSEKNALSSLYEGVANLPDNYNAGDVFPGFSIGKKVFSQEVFGEKPNFLYRFGDPIKLDTGYKYPELVGHFKEYGESYRDFLIRLFSLIIETAKNIDRTRKRTKIVVITHSQQYQMFYDLQTIAKDILTQGIVLEPGQLPLMCWKRYSERLLAGKPTYDVRYITIDSLCEDKVIDMLNREIEYLSKLN